MSINFSIMNQSSSLRLIISSLVISLTIKLSKPYDPTLGTELQLIHRDHLLGHHQLNQSERIRQMFYRDRIRTERMRRMSLLHNPRIMQQNNPTAVISERYGMSGEAANYYAKLMIGTPPKEFLFIVDTGSDLTWVTCKYKNFHSSVPVFFNADSSKSFHTISCSSRYCSDLHSLNFFSHPCKKKNDPCTYVYSFGGQHGVKGIFANEAVTFNLTNGQQATLNSTLIGCTNSPGNLESHVTSGHANGILGLGNNLFSLPMQASRLFGNKFSYCLADIFSNKSSKLFLGASHTMPKNLGRLQSTKLELTAVAIHYGVYIRSISVGGRILNINPAVWDFNDSNGGGSVVDSGATLTYLAESAYKPVMAALRKPLRKFNLVREPNGEGLENCYASKGFNATSALAMEIGFEGGAKMKVLPSSYFFPVVIGDKKEELTCVGILNAGKGGRNVIGNLFQQRHLWEFDIGNRKLNFASSDCVY